MVLTQEALTVEITDFAAYSSPNMHYSRISYNSNQSIGDKEMVVRSVSDYIGKKIKVHQLPDGGYIRDEFVFSIRMREELIMIVFVLGLVAIGMVRKYKNRNRSL